MRKPTIVYCFRSRVFVCLFVCLHVIRTSTILMFANIHDIRSGVYDLYYFHSVINLRRFVYVKWMNYERLKV